MKSTRITTMAIACLAFSAVLSTAMAESITIATVSNGDMVRMQALTEHFTKDNLDISVEWVTLDENTLRQRTTTDIATGGGQFDVVTIGTFEASIWAERDWLIPLDDLPVHCAIGDFLPSIRSGLSHDGVLYGAPLYGESPQSSPEAENGSRASTKGSQIIMPGWGLVKSMTTSRILPV